MQGPTHERLKLLCEQAEAEKDPDKFFEIIREINDMLEAKRSGLGGTDDSQSSTRSRLCTTDADSKSST
jgi:hypothetical protein